MTRKSDARARAIAAAVSLFRIQGYAATGLTQILEHSGAPKGSFYFHFPRGKTELAEQAIDEYVAGRIASFRSLSDATAGDAAEFVRRLFAAFAAEMVASDFRYGCLMQNLANELASTEPELTARIARGFADSTEVIAAHFRGCGFAARRASAAATALVAALEGARTIARLQRTPAVFEALAEVCSRDWTAAEG